ncbi:alpha/beta fold hydrolase [Sporosarcina sp. HYO08]|uniref:alpha/beta fold hydrolase n=1 Tax=Sporosarcina sp. HYO08 TaxID=1759557 RepID=UPI00079BDA5C|nr:alpha/beta hydrolase [Sporosarcina sp. HYO08]KXH80058.1 alpha/beta hydrolase [Sporosarcina sp. HYO08]
MKKVVIEMSDHFLVHAIIFEPKGEPIGHIHLLHGMAEHIARYDEFAQFLVGKGFVVTGHDHRGHGRTAAINGLKGHFDRHNGFERAVQDVREVIAYFREQLRSIPFILFGHSMGSFLARRYIQLYGHDVNAVILAGTSGDPGMSRAAGQVIAYLSGKKDGNLRQNHFLNKLIFGRYNKNVPNPKTPFDWLSRDELKVIQYLKDPACGIVPTTQFFADLFGGLRQIHRKSEVEKIPKNLPILLLSGSKDPVGKNGKAVWKVAGQMEQAGIKRVTVMLFEGGRHELLHEKNRQNVFKFVNDWIEKR